MSSPSQSGSLPISNIEKKDISGHTIISVELCDLSEKFGLFILLGKSTSSRAQKQTLNMCQSQNLSV